MRTKRIIDKMKKKLRSSLRGTTAYLARPLINPVFAQLETVLLCRFLAVKDRALDALDFYNRAEAAYRKSLWKFLTATIWRGEVLCLKVRGPLSQSRAAASE